MASAPILGYNVKTAEEKEAAAKPTFTFPAVFNEQTFDEIGQGARKREFASVDNVKLTRRNRHDKPDFA